MDTTPLPSVFDMNSLANLKTQVKSEDPQALRAAAQQFEALFLNMVLKSMREATPRDGMFNNEQTKMYESLLDQQLAQVLSSKGGGTGLAAMIERQLTRQSSNPEDLGALPLNPNNVGLPLEKGGLPFSTPGLQRGIPLPGAFPLQRGPASKVDPTSAAPNTSAVDPISASPSGKTQAQYADPAAEFVARLRPYAVAAEQASGIPAHFMVAQAALETGWGRAEPKLADGRQSFNLFGIKAGRNWTGATVEASTVEYVNGQAQRQSERFRAYGSYAEAFQDYANLIGTNPRYGTVLASRDPAEFARGLQSAGYATDPQYAAKLERVMGSPALRGLSNT